ncbi:MAG: carboxypeptidase regulatory-like domain-containing protein [Thermoplasmatota archaeon]
MKLHLVAAAFLITGLIAAPVPVQAQQTHSFEGLVCAGYAFEEGWCEWGSLPGATVAIHKDGNLLGIGAVDKSTETGKDGSFAFSDLEAGTYQVSLSRDGFEPVTEPVEVGSESFRTFGLHGAMVEVSGFVESDNGVVSGAAVSFLGDQYLRTETDSNGNFDLELPAGYYTIQAEHKEFRSSSYYQLVDGSNTVSIAMESAPGRDTEIKGVVLDQNGDAVPDVRVNLNQCCGHYEYDEKPREASTGSSGSHGGEEVMVSEPYPYYDSYQETVTDANGAFSFYGYEGYYDLNFYKDGYAQVWQSGDTAQDNTIEVTMEKFPEKTVTIKGKILGEGGKGLGAASISISNEKYGQYECTTYEQDAQGDDDMVHDVYYGGYYGYGCSIVMKDDGSFEGKVMPGYSIISIYYDHWRTCDHSQSSDGSSSTSCGTNYYSASLVRNFQADTEYDLTTRLVARPGPDAEVNGYILTEDEKGIANAQINFNRLDGYSYAWAQVDEHGSYRLALVSGYYSVSVYADGYFRWEGNLQIEADSVTPFDVTLTEGQGSYGYCCYHYGYAEDRATTDGAESAPSASHGGHLAAPASGGTGNEGADSDEVPFQNLGGLGPYDKEKRANTVDASNEAPPVALLVACVGLLGFALLRRR